MSLVTKPSNTRVTDPGENAFEKILFFISNKSLDPRGARRNLASLQNDLAFLSKWLARIPQDQGRDFILNVAKDTEITLTEQEKIVEKFYEDLELAGNERSTEREEKEKLQHELHNSKRENEKISKDQAKLTQENRDLSSQVEGLEEEIKDLKRVRDVLSENLSSLEKANNKLEGERDEARDCRSELDNSNQELQSKYDDIKHNFTRQEKLTAQLETRYDRAWTGVQRFKEEVKHAEEAQDNGGSPDWKAIAVANSRFFEGFEEGLSLSNAK